jgi:2-methylcitrate dehydratase PrpD
MTREQGEPIALQLARFCTRLRYEDLPSEVVEKTKLCLLDMVGVLAAGAQTPTAHLVAEYVRQLQSRPESLVIGKGFRTDAGHAALANGTFSHSLEMEDQHNPSITHPSPVLTPAALAVGEREAVDGKRFIVSLVAGIEVMTRMGMAIAPSVLVERGFHPTSVAGTLGAAAVAGSLLGLPADRFAHALSIAAMHSSGLLEYQSSGGEFKRVHAGMAAQGGIRSALLARSGMTGPLSVIEGEKGFLNAFSSRPSVDVILAGLGTQYQVLKVAFKPYASCRLTHSSIDAVRLLKKRHGLDPAVIQGIRIEACTTIAKLGNPKPADTFAAQFSVPFSAALALICNSNLYRDYGAQNINRCDLLALAGKVELVSDPAWDARYPALLGARATIRMKDGRELTETVTYPSGEPENPISPEGLKEKFWSLISTLLPPPLAQCLVERIDGLERVDDVRRLIDILSQGTAA